MPKFDEVPRRVAKVEDDSMPTAEDSSKKDVRESHGSKGKDWEGKGRTMAA